VNLQAIPWKIYFAQWKLVDSSQLTTDHQCTHREAMSTDEQLVASAAHCTDRRTSVYPAFAARKASHGNDRVWKAWKAMKPASHPSHTLWKSLWDYHIPTASATGSIFQNSLQKQHPIGTASTARGL
jgi:hypothetical protein